jgi:VanZ family protein
MADWSFCLAEQPWRNPRPRPELAELRARTPEPRSWAWLRAWFPALCWAGVIFFMSTDTFSAEHTGSVLQRILSWLAPSLSEGNFELIHHLIRKGAHFTEYFIFSALLYRGVRGGKQGWRWSWGFSGLFIAAAYSALDEIHQAFVASRTASPYDSLLDTTGAFAAMIVLFLWFRWRAPKIPGVASALDPS